jgi:hypothetical protein
MTLSHIEIHVVETAADAVELDLAGLPRIDLEPQECGSCSEPCGEVLERNGKVSWKPCAIALNETRLAVICLTCGVNRVEEALDSGTVLD